MLSVNTNTAALNARGSLVKSSKEMANSITKLSSGRKVDDATNAAAGQGIASRMTAQIRGLNMAVKNSADALSLAQTADGAAEEVTNLLQRIRELAVQSANSTLNSSDRSSLNVEIQALKAEIDQIANNTTFAGQKLLDGNHNATFQIGDGSDQNIELEIGSVLTSSLGVSSSSTGSKSNAELTSASLTGSLGATGTYFAATPLAAGGYVASYENAGGSLYYQRFDIDGNKVGAEIAFATDFNTHVPSMTELANGNLAIGWQAYNYGTGRREAKYAVYDASDNLILAGQSSQASGDDHLNVKLVDLGSGQFAIDYQVHDNFPSSAIGSKMRVFNYDGSQVGDEFQYDNAGSNTRGDLQSLGGGKVATLQFHESTEKLKLHIVDTANETVSTTTEVHTFTNQVANIELVRGTDCLYVTFHDNGASYLGKFGLDGSVIKSPTALSYDGLQNSAYEAMHVVEIEPSTLMAVFSRSPSGHATEAKLFQSATFDGIGDAIVVDANNSTADESRLITDGNGKIAVVTEAAGNMFQNVVTATLSDSVSNLSVTSLANATKALGTLDNAIQSVNELRGELGALQNRLGYRVEILTAISTATSSARGRILDVDFGAEVLELTKKQVLSQASTNMLSQANQVKQSVLALLD